MSHPLYLVATDGSEASLRAEQAAVDLAKATGAQLEFVHIIPWSAFQPIGVEAAYQRPINKTEEERVAKEQILNPALAVAKQAGVDARSYHSWGHAADLIRDRARSEKAAMIIVGKKGRSNLGDMIIGSVANSLAHIASVPVLLIP